jgi:hypothetical protein
VVVAFSASFPLPTTSFSLFTDQRAVPQPSAAQIVGFQQPLRSSGSVETTTSLYATTDKEKEDDLISEMDARILQSMLRDNKLDLEQTSNMKKLLERGIRKEEEDGDDEKSFAERKKEENAEDDTYSSQVIKTLADTKFWKAFKRNAGEVLESVAISLTNEIEKGAKVLVGLGFFAWERAAQDVARALPNVATVPKKKVFQLGETSSFVEPTVEEEEDEMTPSQRAKSIRQEFTTPADELSAVTAEIGKIFQRADRQVALQSQEDKSKDTRNPFFAAFAEERELQQLKSSSGGDSTPFYASASLSTTASRGTARLDKAFERTKTTKLAREKENLAVKGNRLASAAIDSAYQVKTEITSEENIPGYKTKQLRESTVDASRRLAGAAKKTAGFLGGASNFLLGNKEEPPPQQQLPEVGTSANQQPKADPVDFLDDAAYFAFKREEPPPGTEAPPVVSVEEDLSGGIVIEDNQVIDTDQPERGGGGGGAFGFFSAITKRGKKKAAESPISQETVPLASPQQQQPEMEIITDAEVFYTDADVVTTEENGGSSSPNPYFSTNGYLDNMEASSGTTAMPTTEVVDDGLRQVTAEVISDEDFDETAFAQATSVDNMSAEELLEQQASEEADENSEPNFVTKATLRSLDVAFLVVEKGVSVAPAAFELVQRAASRATDAKLKDSTGSQIGWEFLNGNVRGDKRY